MNNQIDAYLNRKFVYSKAKLFLSNVFESFLNRLFDFEIE